MVVVIVCLVRKKRKKSPKSDKPPITSQIQHPTANEARLPSSTYGAVPVPSQFDTGDSTDDHYKPLKVGGASTSGSDSQNHYTAIKRDDHYDDMEMQSFH